MKNKDDGNYLLSIRIDTQMNDLIEEKTKELNINKSKLIKQAFKEWIITKSIIRDRNMLMIAKPFFEILLDEIPEEKLIEIARKNGEHFLNGFKIKTIKEDTPFDINTLLMDISDIFGGTLNNWFDIFDYKINESNTEIHIYGLHALNIKFSLYVKEMLSYVITKSFNQYKLIPTDDTVMVNAIHLIFRR